MNIAVARRHFAALLAIAGIAGVLPTHACGQAPEPGEGESSSSWFESSSIDLGRYLEGEVAKGEFSFKNPDDKPFNILGLQPSCTCSQVAVRIGDKFYQVTNDPHPNTMYLVDEREPEKGQDARDLRQEVEAIPVGPGTEGKIEMQMDLRGVNGSKEASITLRTDDPENPAIQLKARAMASQFFRLVPPEVNLNKMNWQEQREFSVQITSPIQEDFEITGHADLPEKMEIEYTKEMRDGRATWTVRGTYGPNVDPKAGGGIVQLETNVEGRRVPLRVMAWVEGPLEVRPSTFVTFGRIKRGTEVSRVIEFEPTDDYDLQIESVEFKNLSIDEGLVTAEVTKDGKVCKLEIKISKDVPRRLVRGDITVKLNHPAAAEQELQFNGFVR